MEQTRTDRPCQHLTYPEATMYELVARVAQQYPDEPAYEFYDRKTSYAQFIRRIERAARALWAFGVRPGDAVTICLPNIPQALDCFYAVNRMGAVCNMVHPLSAQSEITYYLNVTESKVIVTVDLFYEKVAAALAAVDHPVTILTCRMQEVLPVHLKLLYTLKKGKDYLKFPQPPHLLWTEFLKGGDGALDLPAPSFEKYRTAVILYSGGTTGEPKGICLTDLNFNACAMQAMASIQETFRTGLKMLSCMPLFHGFGLGINIHTVLIHGACCILMPTFTPKTYAQMLKRKRPNFIAGVPTIFEALLHMPQLDGLDMGFLMGMFCGGDSLSVELKKKIDAFLQEHHAHIQVREGYGLTECVTASCLTPKNEHREGSIGLPFPDTVYAIVKPDGDTWLYTGDLGFMDEDGYVYFRQRLKRLIITNGYNIYPGQLENIIDSCPEVAYSCVIGVKDPRRMQKVKAFIVPREGETPGEALQERIMAQLRLHIAKYALPREIEFRQELPKTLVGKVAYRLLEAEEEQKSA